jgi:hypothetical protein
MGAQVRKTAEKLLMNKIKAKLLEEEKVKRQLKKQQREEQKAQKAQKARNTGGKGKPPGTGQDSSARVEGDVDQPRVTHNVRETVHQVQRPGARIPTKLAEIGDFLAEQRHLEDDVELTEGAQTVVRSDEELQEDEEEIYGDSGSEVDIDFLVDAAGVSTVTIQSMSICINCAVGHSRPQSDTCIVRE